MPKLGVKLYAADRIARPPEPFMECDSVGVTLDGAVYWILRAIRVELIAVDAEYKRTVMQCTLSDMIALLTDPDNGFHQ